MNTWKVVAATLLIFAAGLVAGGVLTKRWMPSARPEGRRSQSFLPRPLRAEYLKTISRELDLTQQQHLAVSNVLHSSQERVRILYELIGPDVAEEMRLTREEIRTHLTPEQRKKYDNLPSKRGWRTGEPHPSTEPRPPKRTAP